MKNSVYVASSLDGFIAGPDDSLEWLDEFHIEGEDYGYSEFMSGIDAIVMGRKTFDVVKCFGGWPYEKPVFVITGNPDLKSDSSQYEFLAKNPVDIVEDLHSRGYLNLYVDGGRTIQSFMKKGLIDEIIISWMPVLLGGGTKLFEEFNGMIRLSHYNTSIYDNGIVKSCYSL